MRNAGPKTPPVADIPGSSAHQLTTPPSQPPTDGSPLHGRPQARPPQVPDYELLRRIGGGSYGEVWLARSVLGTWRAVKIVYRSSFDHDRPFEREFEGIQKFEPISRAHDSQVDILHVGKGDGYFYYVMELADDAERPGISNQYSVISKSGADASIGSRNTDSLTTDYCARTLKLDLQRRGRLPPKDCVQIGLALTTALAHLHEHGLVHRDVKPSNIIFVDGRAKLADIGLVTSVDATRSFVGTEGYLPSEGAGTPQADLYSLGKVLYEMSTGQDRRHFPALPADVAQLPDARELAELNAIVVKACQLDPRLRYQSAAEMQADLALLQRGQSVKRKRAVQRRLLFARRITLAAAVLALLATGVWLLATRFHASTVQRFNASAPTEVNSIAVLPFVNESTNYPPHEYLASALTDETMNALTNCAGLRVAPRSEVFAFKRATNDLREIREQLGVRTVLAGTFLRTSNGMRLTLRFLDMTDGTPPWTTNFNRAREELEPLGADAIQSAAHALGFAIQDAVLDRARTNLTRKLVAYRHYSDGIQVRYTSEEAISKSVALLSRAIVEDPDFGQAYAALAHAYTEATGWILPPNNAMTAAKLNAQRALRLDDSLVVAHIVLGNVLLYHELDFSKAEAEFRRAIELGPLNAAAYVYYAMLLAGVERFEEADQMLERGEQIDPKAQFIHSGWCSRYYYGRRFEDTLRAATNYLTVLPNHQTVGVMYLGRAQERLGHYDDALATAQRLMQLSPDLDSVAFLGLVHARLGHRDEAERSLEELRVMSQSRGGSAQYSAKVLLALGDKAGAIKQLQQAVAEYPPVVLRLKSDPFWDDLRADSDFPAMLKGSGLEK